MYQKVEIVIDQSMRGLCKKAYPNHKKGCPNYNKRHDCPPKVPLISKVLDLTKPIYAIWNVYDFKAHTDKMTLLHTNQPGKKDWSIRQIECCLYWQGTARKHLRAEIGSFIKEKGEHLILTTPEACGVNITETMKNIGIILEWPPKTVTHQVALAGTPIDSKDQSGDVQMCF
ncbi:hypothetical protein KAR91_81280 [Candidatus Pacearchaeota archaeon]|nr:hypothetical protein [Candidatus Pacearchaeota archaeon]